MPRTPPLYIRGRVTPRNPELIQEMQAQRTACIVTCHNYGKFLQPCLDSLLNQTLPFDSIIVVDDASTDITPTVAKAYTNRRVQYLRGDWKDFTQARMAGYEAAPWSNFLLFVDADNYLEPNFHEVLRRGMTAPDIAVTYGNIWTFGEDDPPNSRIDRTFNYDRLRRTNLADACSLIRREAFDQVGGWQASGTSGFTDWLLWLRLTRLGWTMRWCPDTTLNYRVHGEQMSRTVDKDWQASGLEVLKRGAKIGITTLFSGRHWTLTPFFNALRALDWPKENLRLIAMDNSRSPSFKDALLRQLNTQEIPFIYSRNDLQAVPSLPANEFAGSAPARQQHNKELSSHMAHLYADIRATLPADIDYVFSLEDDIIPEPHTVARLLSHFVGLNDIGAVGGVVLNRWWPGVIAWEDKPNHNFSIPDDFGTSMKEVDAMGFGCVMMPRPVFDSLAFRPNRWWTPNRYAYDWAAYADVKGQGLKVFVDGQVRPQHLHPGG